jgi:Flp pilus assembly pilin Flp
MRQSRGQGMTEYIVIVALVAISAIAAVTIFGDDVKALFGMSADALAGDAEVAARTQEGGVDRRTLKTYGENSASSPSGSGSGGTGKGGSSGGSSSGSSMHNPPSK